MYESYYHLTADPFQLSPDPRFYFDSLSHKKAMAYLTYGLSREEGFIVISGDTGKGKTTLAHILANELGVSIRVTSGPVLDKPGDLAGLLTNLDERDVLFIDEIHRLSPVIEEYLYSAMEDYKIDIMIESGPNARTVQINLAPFTLVGATTRSGLLTAPMRARFGISSRLEYYTTELLTTIIQ